MKNLTPYSPYPTTSVPSLLDIKELRLLGLVVFIMSLFVFVIWKKYRGGKVVHPSRDMEMNGRVYKKFMMYKCGNIIIMYNVKIYPKGNEFDNMC